MIFFTKLGQIKNLVYFLPQQIESIAPKATAYAAGRKLSATTRWEEYGHSDRAIWGKIKGSGKKPYFTQIDLLNVAYKCSCPSRQFPCKHGLGLMLLFAGLTEKPVDTEPEWVADWMDKRSKKRVAKEEKELSPEEIEKKEIAKEQRAENRLVLVEAGIAELQLWLSDLVRGGLLELPNKPKSYFANMAARMVDAKAPSLSGWVKSLGNIDYASPDKWFEEATTILAKLNLLLSAWNNKEQLTEDWQQSIKNHIGWSQSPKKLMTDKEATVVKDYWLTIGQEKEGLEELTILRTWLWGINSNKSCLILNFGTAYSTLENTFMTGTVTKSEVAFFSGHYLQRGIVRTTVETLTELPEQPNFHQNIKSFQQDFKAKQAQYPWLNNEPFLVRNIRLGIHQGIRYLVDEDHNTLPIISSFDEEANKKWILKTGNYPVDIAFVLKGKTVLPLGTFTKNKYEAL